MINFKKININININNLKLNFKLNLTLNKNIKRYNHSHFTDYDKMIRNMKTLRDKMDGCLKEKYIFKYQHNLNLEGHNNKYIVDKYTFSIIHNNHNKYINYCNYNYNFNNKINQIIIYEDFNKMLETMKMKKIEFHQFTTNYLINTKYSFINLNSKVFEIYKIYKIKYYIIYNYILMLSERKFEEKFELLTKQIVELKEKITKLENMLLIKYNCNDYNDYNICNDVIMDNAIDRSTTFYEPPPLVRQKAFNK